MTFCPTRLIAGLMVIAGLCPFPGRTQQTIQFSKPISDVTATANSFMTEDASRKKNSPGAHNAPTSLFGNGWGMSDYDVLPGLSPAPAVSSAEAQKWQKFLEGRKKWAMMTPEEIMGLPTPEKIMGLPDKYGEDKLSTEERFLKRQERATFAASHGDSRHQNNLLTRGSLGSLDQKTGNFPSQSDDRSSSGSATYFNQSLSAKAGSFFGSADEGSSKWSGGFTLPTPPPQKTPEQLAGMERFRAMMEPNSPPDKLVPTRAATTTGLDSHLQPVPQFNPLGRTFTPLPSGFSQPTGIKPLPGITEPYPASTAAKPARKTDLPPWLSNDEGAPKFGQPRRKF